MSFEAYRLPNGREREFLRVVTRGYRELEAQIEACEIGDYDPTGWCEVRILAGPPSAIRYTVDGPALLTGDPDAPFVEILLWTNVDGMLATIEVVDYGAAVADPYGLFIEAARAEPPRLTYRFAPAEEPRGG